MNLLQRLFSTNGMMPHGHCYLWEPPLVWLHVISDGLIALSYLTIPVTLIYIARKRKDLPFDWIFACFGLFILACGATHALEIWTLWTPTYWLSGTAKAITAAVSVMTAILLVKLIPQLLAIPSPATLRLANAALREEAAERMSAEAKLRDSHALLEHRVAERTHELETTNAELQRQMAERQRIEDDLSKLNDQLENLVAKRTAELRRSDREFRSTFERAAMGIVLVEPSGEFLKVNPHFCAIGGYTESELIGTNFAHVAHPDDLPGELVGVQSLLRGDQTTLSIEKRLKRKDGNMVWIHLTASAVHNEDDTVAYLIGFIEDISERRQAAVEIKALNADLEQRVLQRTAELADANKALDRASQLKDEFLANMSHELRTPLNAILGLSEALIEQSGGPLSPRQAKSITTISTSGQHLLELINDILDLSKIEAGKVDLHREQLIVEEFCQSCLIFVRTQAMQKHIEIVFECDRPEAQFTVDAKRFKQVLVNLLTNAVKFTPANGEIGLKVTMPENGGSIGFTVWDTGIGISAEDQLKLFQVFTQIDSGLSRSQEGTGLGLALVAKLVELHGGSVSIESETGQGSRFTVTVPQKPAPASSKESPPPEEPDRRGYRHALIIEDDPSASEQLERYLTEMAISSFVHARGEDTVEIARREHPDVILLDILLPNENGWGVLERLQQHPDTQHIPVVIISVMDEPKKLQALGAAASFTKPVTRAQLAGFFQREVVQVARTTPPFETLTTSTGSLVLLAEDNEANIETVGDYLADRGYQMHYARNGLIAVQLARELNPAIILMDIQMPVMDGLAAIREIRADATMRDLPIIALTALAMPGDRERCLAAGATAYLSKPVGLKGLATLIARLVPDKKRPV